MSELEPLPIVTARLVLRAYVAEDEDAFIALNTDAEVRAFMDGALTLDAARRTFARVCGRPWAAAIVARENGAYLGHVFLAETMEFPGAARELGFLLVREAWGRGVATEAARALVARAGVLCPSWVVWATVDDGHDASIRVLEKLGFVHDRAARDERGVFHIYRLVRGEG